MTEARHWAVVPAAGIGRRMGTAIPKQYLTLAGRRVIEHTLETLLGVPRILGVVVAVAPQDRWWQALSLATDKSLLRVAGGQQRCHSVINAVEALREHLGPDDWVLVHDAARPCLCRADLDRLMDALVDDPVGGLLAVPVRDTMKRADAAGRIRATENRQGLWHALTPQMFRFEVLRSALRRALARGLEVTDESSAVEAAGLVPRLIEGRADNIKITRPEDLALAEIYLRNCG